jgi:ribosomal protein S27AE
MRRRRDAVLVAAFFWGVANFISAIYHISDVNNLYSMCPRCGTARLRRFDELGEEEREVVKRLPASADAAFDERKSRHRWCPRCWYEDTGREAQHLT